MTNLVTWHGTGLHCKMCQPATTNRPPGSSSTSNNSSSSSSGTNSRSGRGRLMHIRASASSRASTLAAAKLPSGCSPPTSGYGRGAAREHGGFYCVCDLYMEAAVSGCYKFCKPHRYPSTARVCAAGTGACSSCPSLATSASSSAPSRCGHRARHDVSRVYVCRPRAEARVQRRLRARQYRIGHGPESRLQRLLTVRQRGVAISCSCGKPSLRRS